MSLETFDTVARGYVLEASSTNNPSNDSSLLLTASEFDSGLQNIKPLRRRLLSGQRVDVSKEENFHTKSYCMKFRHFELYRS